MIAGLVLQENVEQDSIIAFLGDELEIETVSTNEEIAELIQEKKPEVIAANIGTNSSPHELNQDEEELKEEGYAFTPTSHETQRSRRMEALNAQLFELMGAESPEAIRFNPHITAEELAIHGDEGIESLGVETDDIESAEQFDAALGAITARFYQQNQYEDMGVIIPESMDTEESNDEKA
jgi:hypothetical protein